MYVEKFPVGYQLVTILSYPNRDHFSTIEKKIFLKNSDQY
jgi:hypothetical protein